LASKLESQISKVNAKFRYPNSKVLKEITSSLSEIIEEANFEISKDGIKVVGTDPAKVAYIEINMPYDTFLDYDVKNKINMGVNVTSLYNIISRSRRSESILFMVSDQNILIEIEGEIIKRFLLPNLEVVLDVPTEIKLDHDVKLSIIGDAFKKVLSDASVFGDIIELEVNEDKFIIRSQGEGPKAEASFIKGSGSLVDLEVKRNSTSRYDINYLRSVLNLAKVAETVEISFSSDKPIQLIFNAPDKSRIRYLLAPSSSL
jgi:proliferating cell nuclear antigen